MIIKHFAKRFHPKTLNSRRGTVIQKGKRKIYAFLNKSFDFAEQTQHKSRRVFPESK